MVWGPVNWIPNDLISVNNKEYLFYIYIGKLLPLGIIFMVGNNRPLHRAISTSGDFYLQV